MSTVTDQQAARHAVAADKWDVAEYDRTRDKMPMLAAAEREMKDVNWTGDRLLHDVWQLAYQPLPELQEPVEPSFAVNLAVAKELKQSDALTEMRAHTVNNPGASALGAASMRAHLRNVYKRLEEVQRKADEAQEKLNEARQAEQQAAGGSGAGDPGDDDQRPSSPGAGPSAEEVQAMFDAADAAIAEMEAALDEEVPAISKAAREAAAGAAAEAQKNAEACAAWGLDPGRAADMDPAEYADFLDEIADPFLRQLAQMIGAMRNDIRGLRERDTNRIPVEIYDVELGDNLERLLPCELVNLGVDELEDDLYRRYTEKQLLVYKMRGRERTARGPVIYIEDCSDSMFMRGGHRHKFARSLGGGLLSIAVDDRRGFEAIVFGGRGQITTFRFDEPADFTPARQLEYAKFRYEGAGTDFVTPFDAALAYMEAEYAAKRRTESDIVFATDGEASVPAEWLAAFKERQAVLKFRVFGLAVAMPRFPTLDAICDGRVVRVDNLHDASDIQEMLQELSR